MTKIIIGIHGLANKPLKQTLETWWKTSILEGLSKNVGLSDPNLNFKMVFWADLLYKNPMHDDEKFYYDRLFNREPYVEAKPGALKEYRTRFFDRVRAGLLDVVGDTADFLKYHFDVNKIADWLLGKVLRDLAFYYDDNRKIANRSDKMELAWKVLRDEFKNAIREEKDKEIMIIGHSMGSIIAYDALRDLGRSDPGLEVPYFVTIGSPLGLPHVKGKIIKERDYDPDVRTPSIVTKSWKNYADKDDVVAVDVHLRGDYGKNKHGVLVEDDLVANDYIGPLEGATENPHKSYGYLRTPELSRHIKSFLQS